MRDTTPTERDEQLALLRWIGLMQGKHPCLALLYHVPNASKRHISYAVRQKAEGLKAGVPDLHLPVPRGIYHGLWLELKRRKGGRVSDRQRWWHERLREQGHRVVVAEGWEAAKDAIEDYLRLNAA